MPQKRVKHFTASGSFVVPIGATYAIAHCLGGGGGANTNSLAAGNGGNSSVAFTSGTITAPGGPGKSNNGGGIPTGHIDALPTANGGKGGGSGSPGTTAAGILYSNSFNGANGATVVGGAPVAYGETLAVTVGLGGVATGGANSCPGGSGFVWIEYY